MINSNIVKVVLVCVHCVSCWHRHGIDKYLDTLLANQTARKVMPPTMHKMADCRVIISLILPNPNLCVQCFDTVGWAAGRASGL